MNSPNSPTLYKIAAWLAAALFAAGALIWILSSYQYSIVKFISEMQFFHTDRVYFQQFSILPGGLTLYAGSFISQFFHYPVTGSIILTLTLLFIYLLMLDIMKQCGAIHRFFALAMVVPVTLLFLYNPSNAVMYYRLAHFLGIVLALGAFSLYLRIPSRFRMIGGILLYLALYSLAAGNALLFAALLCINELFRDERSWLYLAAILVVAAGTPLLAHRFIYIATMNKVWWALTPFDSPKFFNIIYCIAWCAIPILYLLWQLLSRLPSVRGRGEKTGKMDRRGVVIALVLCNLIVVGGVALYGIKNYRNKEIEGISQMAYEVEQGNWDRVIELGEGKNYLNAVPISYFTNIARLANGTLPEKMFTYRQTGTYGLFDSWAIRYSTCLFIGEIYYRLGVPAIAEQCAFEALVCSPYEHSSKAARRIVQTSMMRKDTESFEKYIRLFEKSPIYRKWAAEQRLHFEKSLQDPGYKVPGLPETARFDNFMFAFGEQQHNLISMLHSNPCNRKAFEYLMAFSLLRKDLTVFLEFMDQYYENMNYEKLPRAFEEALLILAYNDMQELLLKYEISPEAIARFNSLNNEIAQASNAVLIRNLQKRHHDTYWIYYRYTKPMMLENIPDLLVY